MTGWIVYAFVALATSGNSIQSAKKHGYSDKAANTIALLIFLAFVVFGLWVHFTWWK